jgi:prepilin signal peptidase PulO-like enzyme (type II secretory pathway)
MVTGIVFVFLFLRLPFNTSLFIHLILWPTLIVTFFYDIRHKIIPDTCSLAFFFCATMLSVLTSFGQGVAVLLHHSLAAMVLAGIFFLLWFVSNGRWMGFGDVKLALGIGMYLGFAQGLSALAFAFWIGAGYSLARIALERLRLRLGTKQLSSSPEALTMKSEVPFAPFLIVGTFLAFWFSSDLFHLNFFFLYA